MISLLHDMVGKFEGFLVRGFSNHASTRAAQNAFGMLGHSCKYPAYRIYSEKPPVELAYMQGSGKLTSPTGTVYEGSWREGKRHGKGRLSYKVRLSNTYVFITLDTGRHCRRKQVGETAG